MHKRGFFQVMLIRVRGQFFHKKLDIFWYSQYIFHYKWAFVFTYECSKLGTLFFELHSKEPLHFPNRAQKLHCWLRMTESQNHQTLAAQNSNIYGDAITQRSDFYLCPSVRKIGKTNVLFRVNHPVLQFDTAE